jgi:hypothetical protein
MKNNELKNNRYDWAIFAYSYLLIAKLACQELLSKREDKYSKNLSKDNDRRCPYKEGY